jgi:hypothetical protein
MSRAARFIFAGMILIAGAYVQYARIAQVGGVNPDIVMVLAIVYMFFLSDTVVASVLVLAAALLVKWEPGMSYGLIGFMGVLFLVWVLRKHIRWQPLVGVSVLTAGATALLALVVDPYFLVSHPGIVMGEVVYNVALGGLFLIVGSQEGE